MDEKLKSLRPIQGADRTGRRRLTWRGEMALAVLPTLIVLAVLALVEEFTHQRLLFASLASSAFLIYLDPQHATNSVRTLLISQLGAALVGFLAFFVLGPGYASAATAMVVTIAGTILLDAVHPPAVSTTLSFAFKADNQNNLVLFALAVGMVAILVVLQRFSVWLLARYATPD